METPEYTNPANQATDATYTNPADQPHNSEYTEQKFAERPEFAHIVGVFRDTAQANSAAEELKQAGFANVNIKEYDSPSVVAGENAALATTEHRALVQVEAVGREEEAVGILARNGANNADIPHGTELVQGDLVSSGAPLTAQPSTTNTSANASLFSPEHSGSSTMDTLANDPRLP